MDDLLGAEHAHREECLAYHGSLRLWAAYKSFYLEMIPQLNKQVRADTRIMPNKQYDLLVPQLTTAFLSLAGAEQNALAGYPFNAFTVLRNIEDNLMLTSAVLQKYTTFLEVEGLVEGQQIDMKEVKKLRKQTEEKVRKRMKGHESGLTQSTKTQLTRINNLYDYEVHGSRLSLSRSMDWYTSDVPLHCLPVFNEKDFVVFLNRYSEIAWMFFRLLPNLQRPGHPLPEPWGEKFEVLDGAFRQMVGSLKNEEGDEIGLAIVEYIDHAFPFSEETYFPLK